MPTKAGIVFPVVQPNKVEYIHHFGDGLVATNGVVYTPVVTLADTETDVIDKLITPGFGLSLDWLEIGFTQRFTELTDAQGTVNYRIQVRSEGPALVKGVPEGTIMSYVDVTGTYTKGVGSLLNSEDTMSGFISVASLPRAPFRIKVSASALTTASQLSGQVKNSSFVRFFGSVIPGT